MMISLKKNHPMMLRAVMLITKNTSNHNVVRPEWAVILRPFFTTLNNYIMEE